ncbi:DUF4238 domain-containing protein [Idiomarina abyssalis]|uniref:DUF4238 domain-containing protein n=1 Tax=Idiomarina abyssalis TaxID=86102 RepID=UPI003A92D283
MPKLTEKQHYVPKLLLRGFAVNESKSLIHIYDVSLEKERNEKSIKTYFQESFFYDTDNLIEKYIGENIEDPVGKVIESLKNNTKQLSDEEKEIIIRFIGCQYGRTLASREEFIDLLNDMQKPNMRNILKSGGFDESLADTLRITPKGDDSIRMLTTGLTLNGIIQACYYNDLDVHILENDTNTPFLISDHPIIQYNWLYKDLDSIHTSSLRAKGLMMLLPISSSTCICAFDSTSYKLGTRKQKTTHISEDDVNWINETQVINSHKYIGFSDQTSKPYVENLVKRHKDKNAFNNELSIELGIVIRKQLNFNYKPHFFKLIKSAKNSSTTFLERESFKKLNKDFLDSLLTLTQEALKRTEQHNRQSDPA